MVSWPQCSPLIGQYAANWSPSYSIMQENILHHGCGYTLWYLEPTVRSALEPGRGPVRAFSKLNRNEPAH